VEEVSEADDARAFLKAQAEKSAAKPKKGGREGLMSRSLPDIGATVGSVGGQILGGEPGSILGAGAGGAVGEAGRQVLNDRPMDFGAIAKEGGKQAGFEAVGSAAMRGVSKVGRRLLGVPMKRMQTIKAYRDEIARGAGEMKHWLLESGVPEEVADRYARQPLTAAQISDNKIVQFMHSLSAGSLFGSRKATDFLKHHETVAKILPRSMVESAGQIMDGDTVARAAIAKMDDVVDAKAGRLGALYDQIEKKLATTDVPYDIPYGYKNAEDAVGQLSGLPGTPKPITGGTTVQNREVGSIAGMRDQQGFKTSLEARRAGTIDVSDASGLFARQKKALGQLKGAGIDNPDPEGTAAIIGTIDQIESGGLPLDFSTVKQLRTEIKSMMGKVSAANPKSSYLAAATELDAYLTRKMRRSLFEYDQAVMKATGENPGLTKMYAFAEDAARTHYKDFDTEMLRGWLDVVNSKNRGPQVVKEMLEEQNFGRMEVVLKTLGETKETDMLRSWHLQSMWDGVKGDADDFIRSFMFPGSGMGRETMERLHGKDSVKRYIEFGRHLKEFQRPMMGEGKTAIIMIEAGAVAGAALAIPAVLYAGGSEKQSASTAGGIILTTKGLSHIMGSEALAKAFIDGSPKAGLVTKATTAAMLRVMNALLKDEYTTYPAGGTYQQFRDSARAAGEANAPQ
jgi:hypothetical protein